MIDDVVTEWTRLKARAENMAITAQADPELAASLGIQPVSIRRPGAAADKDLVEAPIAPWLRAAAQRVIPAIFVWEVVTTVGGAAWLVLKDYQPHDPPDEPSGDPSAPLLVDPTQS